MRNLLRRLRERFFATRRRRIALFAAVAGAVTVLVITGDWHAYRLTGKNSPAPFRFYSKEPDFSSATQSGTPPSFWIRGVTENGRFATLEFAEPTFIPGAWFFDLKNRRFVADLIPPGAPESKPKAGEAPFRLVRRRGGRADHMFLVQSEEQPSRFGVLRERILSFLTGKPPQSLSPFKRVAVYDFDLLERKAHCAAVEDVSLRDRMVFSSFCINRKYNAVAYKLTRRGIIVLHDLETDRKRLITSLSLRRLGAADPTRMDYVKGIRIGGWMPDNRTLGIRAFRHFTPPMSERAPADKFVFQDLYFIDVKNEIPTRKIPVADRLQRLQENGDVPAGAGAVLCYDILLYLDGGRRIRFFATFAGAAASSLWDLDVETEQLTRVMDLEHSRVNGGNAVCSPDGRSVIAVMDGEPIEDGAAALSLYRVGRPPRRLPFRIGWTSPNREMTEEELRYLYGHVNFIDNDTFLYTPSGREIHRFDLRTWKSERLWRPEDRL